MCVNTINANIKIFSSLFTGRRAVPPAGQPEAPGQWPATEAVRGQRRVAGPAAGRTQADGVSAHS